MDDLSHKLALIRRFTGDRFSAARGYDARKKLSRKRIRTINRYYDLIVELTGRSHVVYTPKKGERREAFEYTGQSGYSYFNRAIIHTPGKAAKYDFYMDRTRPQGSRFTVLNKSTQEMSWHIDPDLFWMVIDDGITDEERIDEFTDILNEYAEEAEVFLINAGEHHMWGNAGNAPVVAKKIDELFRNYGADIFDPSDRNSNYIGNWFRGVTAYKPKSSIDRYITDRYLARRKYLEDTHRQTNYKIRYTRYGEIIFMERGTLMGVGRHMTPSEAAEYEELKRKRAAKRKKQKNARRR